uniref:Zinc carboxypeptidase A 1 n=1 Tax=Anopheles epiroticus TaxID=199890 RepID=A0A182PLQ5_9DIPT
MILKVVVCLLVCATGLLRGEQVRYDNYRVYEVSISGRTQLEALQYLERYPDGYLFWESPVQTNMKLNIVVPPHKYAEFDELSNQLALANRLRVPNLQQLIDQESPKRSRRAFGWTEYQTLEDIYNWIDEKVNEFPSIMSVETIGQSYEDRDIKAVKISYKEGNPGIFIESNIHAREWITSATVTWLINEFLTSTAPEVRELAENYDWYIVPVANPDGLNYTKTTNRLWRKNRYPHSVLCYGVDMNRNFPGHWMEGGASPIPCSDVYAGPAAGSEIETQHLMNYFISIKDKAKAYLSFHSYGQYILFPYGHANAEYSENYYDMMEMGEAAAVAIYERFSTPYEIGTTADVLYIASGASPDWAHGTQGTPIAATFEFRDNGVYGFILPPDQIIPNAMEVLDGLVAFCRKGKELALREKNDRFEQNHFEMRSRCGIFLVLFVASVVSGELIRYDNYHLFRVSIADQGQLTALQTAELQNEQFIFLDSPTQVGINVSVLVPPRNLVDYVQLSKKAQLQSHLATTNFQAVLDAENPPRKNRRSDEFNWEEYQTLDAIYSWIDQLAVEYASILTVESIGQTYEGREMKLVKLAHQPGNPGIFIESNIHAREWITSATTTWLLNELLTSSDPAVQELLTSYDWYILPVANPDGFHYTKTTNRLWRKNRYPHNILCPGVDLNRNFPYHWMEGGASQVTCNDIYAGPSPASEVETRNMMEYYETIVDRIELHLQFHSYGQYILLPYGYQDADYPENYSDQMEIAKAAATGFATRYQTRYTYGTIADVLYVDSGSTTDWAHGYHKTPLSMCFEFRDNGPYGFVTMAKERFVLQALLCAVAFVACAHGRLSYENYAVYNVDIASESQLALLQNLEALPNGYTFLDFPSSVNKTVEVVVPPGEVVNAERLFRKHGIKNSLVTGNLKQVLDQERPARRKKEEGFGWDDYHTLEEIYAWIDALVEQHSSVLSVETIGQTYEKRDMKVIKLSYKPDNQAIFIDANIHAREWITSATITWVLNELLTSEDARVRYIAENYDWYIVPVANPDGFVYTHTTERLWRKTRTQHNLLCYGTDPNRNFNFQWNNGGTSTMPCSDNYSGPEPESEVEVSNLTKFVRSIAANVKLSLSIHSRGQYILLPFGYNNAPRTYNYQDLMQVGQRASVDMYKQYSKPYRVGTTADVLYVASGISVDWAHAVAGIPLAYTYELRDQGQFGFILPADQIVPNAEELLEAFVAMIDEAKILGYMMWFKLTLLLVAAIAWGGSAEQARFDNYRVYEVSIETERQLQTLQHLELNPDGYSFWESPVQTNMRLSIVVPPHKFAHFEELTQALAMKTRLQIEDFQKVIDSERPMRSTRATFGWTDYYTVDEIYAWMDQQVAQYPNILSGSVYGKSYEGRDLKVLKLSQKAGNPGIFIEANIHAREWISSATATWLLNELLTSNNPAVQDLAQNYDWYFIMVANPDGLTYSKTTNRQWRKTRQPVNSLCVGTDPNRNFGYKWMNGGASSVPCSDTFAGLTAFSEPETRAMADYYATIADKIKIQFSFHSYGQYLLTPFGYSGAPLPANDADLQRIARVTATAIEATYGTRYTFGNSATTLYTTSGSTVDYFVGEHGTPLGYTFEFRDTGATGFVLPADQIIPNAEETLNGIIAFVAEAKTLGYV